MPRFLHTADWQIGRQYSSFPPEDAAALAEARFMTVERIAQLARDESVDAVLVAGDVFDAQTVSDRTIRRLFNAMTGYSGPWILIPGNHDAALAESVWTRARRLSAVPDNVHLALTRQLQAPLQQHLNRYLQLLFPGASLTVDEDLKPLQLQRIKAGTEERSQFDDLSFGAREQMALISRLACADLLKEAGRATLIILDDALVHSDAERLDAMKRVLFDAARRHQILLFSCHPGNWRDLGVEAREMAGLSG